MIFHCDACFWCFSRAQRARTGMAKFIGVQSETNSRLDESWNTRRLHFLTGKFGDLRVERLPSAPGEIPPPAGESPEVRLRQSTRGDTVDGPHPSFSRQQSEYGRTDGGGVSRYLRMPVQSEFVHRPAGRASAISVLGKAVRHRVQPPLREEGGIEMAAIKEAEATPEVAVSVPTDDRLDGGLLRKKAGRLITAIFNCNYKLNEKTEEVMAQLDASPQYRPYFTYWISFVQLVVFIVAVSCFGFASVGLSVVTQREQVVLQPNLAREKVCRVEYDNMWLGPAQDALVRMGARYAPCMRRDRVLYDKLLLPDRSRENRTGCCVMNDMSACYQSTRAHCSSTLSTWLNWKDRGRVDSGAVCGQDPAFCVDPVSRAPYEWPVDIVRWPLCRKSKTLNNATAIMDPRPGYVDGGRYASHMGCTVSARPCCVGIKGECILTSKDRCDFMRGYFHPEATLCSQVDCLNEVCGMLPFARTGQPDQFYRLWLSLFLHAGVVHLLVSLAVQLWFMRDLEKLAGWHRVAIIYLLSGMLGNLCSATFMPYLVEVGPTGSHFALLATTLVELLQSRSLLARPCCALLKYLAFTLLMFVLGLLPWFDNYAHLIGFVSGAILSYILLPYWSLGKEERRWRILGVILCIILWLGMVALLCVLFYVTPPTACSACKYFNCIPLTPNFCDNMAVNVAQRTACLETKT